ncbi:MAG: 50S ribosomal protein L9 [Pseudomonadota bacterium]
MDIILLERVKSLGEMGAVVSVKPGYARNFLIPTKKALRATGANKDLFAAKKAEIEAKSAAKLEEAQGVYAIIDKNFITIILQAGEDGKLFGSVSPRDISDLVSKTFNQAISHSDIMLSAPIKYIGVHEVNIALHSDLHATIYVAVARTASEANDIQKEFLTPPSKRA